MKYISKYCAAAAISAALFGFYSAGTTVAAPEMSDNSGQAVLPKTDSTLPPKESSKQANISFGDYLSGRFAETSGDSDKSVKYLRESLDHDPGNKDIMLNLYHALIASGDIEGSVPIAKKLDEGKVVDEGDEFSPPLVLMLEAAKRRHYDEAERYLHTVPKAGFNSLLVPLLQAWLKLGNGEIKAPIDAKDIMPNGKMLLPHMYLNAGLIDEVAGFDSDAVLQEYKAAVKESRLESMRAAEALANYYIRKGKKDKFNQFIASYEAGHGETIIDDEIYSKQPPQPLVSNVNEGLAEAFYTVASIFHGIRTPSEEITTLNMALYLRPDFPAARFLLANAYELIHGFDQAIKNYEAIEPGSPYFTQSLIMIAYDEGELGNKSAAVSELDKIAQEKPKSISALLAKGDILRASNNFDEAIAAYDAAIARIKTLQKPDWVIFFSRGICYDRLEKFDKMEEDMKKALAISPDEPDVLNYLGYSWLTKRHNVAEAKKMIEEAYDARPEDAQIIDSMGYALYVEGDFASAQEYFEQALERIPDDPTINEHLGDTYWQLGHKVEANYQWQRALDDKPDEENKKELQKRLNNGLAFISPANTGDKKINSEVQ